jgi:hypothetical protein
MRKRWFYVYITMQRCYIYMGVTKIKNYVCVCVWGGGAAKILSSIRKMSRDESEWMEISERTS